MARRFEHFVRNERRSTAGHVISRWKRDNRTMSDWTASFAYNLVSCESLNFIYRDSGEAQSDEQEGKIVIISLIYSIFNFIFWKVCSRWRRWEAENRNPIEGEKSKNWWQHVIDFSNVVLDRWDWAWHMTSHCLPRGSRCHRATSLGLCMDRRSARNRSRWRDLHFSISHHRRDYAKDKRLWKRWRRETNQIECLR